MYWVKKYRWLAIGVILGSIGGYLYYVQIGCVNGHCSITGDPVNSTIYGALMGGLAFDLFRNKKG